MLKQLRLCIKTYIFHKFTEPFRKKELFDANTILTVRPMYGHGSPIMVMSGIRHLNRLSGVKAQCPGDDFSRNRTGLLHRAD